MPRRARWRARRAGVVLVPGERDNPCARLQMRRHALEGAAVQRKQRAILLAPFEPRGRERKRRGRRNAENFVTRDVARDEIADAVEEGIARGENDRGPAALGENARQCVGERRGPLQALGWRVDHREMTRAADDQRGLRHECARRRRQRLGAVFAKADQRQPWRVHVAFRDV